MTPAQMSAAGCAHDCLPMQMSAAVTRMTMVLSKSEQHLHVAQKQVLKVVGWAGGGVHARVQVLPLVRAAVRAAGGHQGYVPNVPL